MVQEHHHYYFIPLVFPLVHFSPKFFSTHCLSLACSFFCLRLYTKKEQAEESERNLRIQKLNNSNIQEFKNLKDLRIQKIILTTMSSIIIDNYRQLFFESS